MHTILNQRLLTKIFNIFGDVTHKSQLHRNKINLLWLTLKIIIEHFDLKIFLTRLPLRLPVSAENSFRLLQPVLVKKE